MSIIGSGYTVLRPEHPALGTQEAICTCLHGRAGAAGVGEETLLAHRWTCGPSQYARLLSGISAAGALCSTPKMVTSPFDSQVMQFFLELMLQSSCLRLHPSIQCGRRGHDLPDALKARTHDSDMAQLLQEHPQAASLKPWGEKRCLPQSRQQHHFSSGGSILGTSDFPEQRSPFTSLSCVPATATLYGSTQQICTLKPLGWTRKRGEPKGHERLESEGRHLSIPLVSSGLFQVLRKHPTPG